MAVILIVIRIRGWCLEVHQQIRYNEVRKTARIGGRTSQILG